jgi:hypothetical protein
MQKFFIVGCPRSGTTMVQQALNRHSHIAIPPETKYFFSFLGHSRTCQLRHIQRLNADLRIELPTPSTAILSTGEARDFYEAMARKYVHRLPKQVESFGEKTPEHTGHLSRIQEVFPEAKILVLYRDGRDVALSLTRTPWMPAGLYVNFLVWMWYQRIVARAQQSAQPNFYFARYEDIVANPEKEFAGILRFLDLPYEQSVPHGCGNTEGVPEREYAWKARALEKITTERIGTFQRELSATDIGILERLGKQTLSAFGYPLMTGGKGSLSLSFLVKLACKLAAFFYRLPWHSLAHELFGRSLGCCADGLAYVRRAFNSLRETLSGLIPSAPFDEWGVRSSTQTRAAACLS